MTIVLLLDGFDIGGTELNATRTLEAMARRNLFVTVLHFCEDGPLRARIDAAGHRRVFTPISPLWHPRIALRTAALARTIRAVGATVVHAQDVYTNILGVAATKLLRGVPIITSRRWKDDVPRKGMTQLNAWAHRASTLVLPNSPTLIPTLSAEGVVSDRIRVHENFIDDAALTLLPPDEQSRWKAALGIPAAAPLIGCVARLAPVKRHDVLLSAFSQVLHAVPDAILVLVGDGESRAGLESQAAALGIAPSVRFTGTLPNYPLPQQLFDVAVLTSGNEGFPNSLVEASAAAVPLVSSRVGGVPDVLVDDVTGISVDVGSVDQTAAALIRLLRDPALRRRMGDAGRERVRTRFSESAAIDRLMGIYDGVRRGRSG